MTLFLLHAFATLAMTGILWLVQLVQYPLFLGLERTTFQRWHGLHSARITYVVGPLMLLELATAALALFPGRGGGFPAPLFFLATTLAIFAWTAFVSVPLHDRLQAKGFDEPVIRRLIRTNWARTLLYSAKTLAIVALCCRAGSSP